MLLTSAAAVVLFFIYPTRFKSKKVEYLYLTDEDELPKKGVKRLDFQYRSSDRLISMRVFLVADADGLLILSPFCTHLGCIVTWDNNKKEFLCPCHGGRYNIRGEVIGGPPPAPLQRLPFEIRDEKVYVGIKV
ncbi:MAG: ubiquinol-cytochrome c reductase iron-sulfur subunit [Nitrospirae bacterium]|nr:ubiquinol-cytochrome c reductase iron-sulfur subunit [Nitrospirota bacterium]